jgi:hypothetical protein
MIRALPTARRAPPAGRARRALGALLGLVASAGAAGGAAGLWGGCLLAGQSRTDTLQDAVHGMVDELRWARAEVAADRVAVAYRARFVRSREGWGDRIQIADCDLQNVRMARDEKSATAIVTVSWYALDAMDLRQTRIRQRWELVGGAFVLADERVIAGDASLLGSATEAGPGGTRAATGADPGGQTGTDPEDPRGPVATR